MFAYAWRIQSCRMRRWHMVTSRIWFTAKQKPTLSDITISHPVAGNRQKVE